MGLSMVVFYGCVLLSFVDLVNSVSNRRCFPFNTGQSLCFTRPDPLVALSWSDAQQWCSNIGATLPMLHESSLHRVYSNAVGYFGLSSKTMWLGANSTFDINRWYWTNGSIFSGEIDHGNDTRKTHAYIIRNGTDIKIFAADPKNEFACSICELSFMYMYVYTHNNFDDESLCATLWNSYWSHEKCYMKSKNSISWRYSCGENHKTVTLDDLTEMLQWIDEQTGFWIGLRCTWWSWQDVVSGTSIDLTDTLFALNSPNNTSPECLASSSVDSNGVAYWINENCSSELPFICQQSERRSTTSPVSSLSKDSLTISSTSHSAALTRSSEVADTSSTQIMKSTPDPMDPDISSCFDKYGLIVLLGFRLSGGLFLAGIVWLATLTSRVNKSHRHSQKPLQQRNLGNLPLTCSNTYELGPFVDAPVLKEVPSSVVVGAEKAEKPFEELRM